MVIAVEEFIAVACISLVLAGMVGLFGVAKGYEEKNKDLLLVGTVVMIVCFTLFFWGLSVLP